MDLHNNTGVKLLLLQPLVDVYHRHFHNIGGCSLDRSVHCDSFTKGSKITVLRVKLGNVSPSAENGCGVAVPFCILNNSLKIFLNPGIVQHIVFDVSRSLCNGYTQVLRQREASNAVNYAEVYRLCLFAHLLINHLLGEAEYRRCSLSMDILTCGKCLLHSVIVGNVSKESKLYLGVVGVNESVAILGYEAASHLPAHFGFNRNIL